MKGVGRVVRDGRGVGVGGDGRGGGAQYCFLGIFGRLRETRHASMITKEEERWGEVDEGEKEEKKEL